MSSRQDYGQGCYGHRKKNTREEEEIPTIAIHLPSLREGHNLLHRLSFDLRLLITPLISFNFSDTLSKLYVDIRVEKFDMKVENRIL